MTVPTFPVCCPERGQQVPQGRSFGCPQISTCHQLLHPQVLQLLVKLFETEHSQLDVMEQVSCVSGCWGWESPVLTCSPGLALP